jgi:acetyl-CoA carboxylase biotin carboxylase subunit
VHATTRDECLMRLNRALGEFVIDGIEVNIPLHMEMIQQENFIDGDYHIHWLEEFLEQQDDTYS